MDEGDQQIQHATVERSHNQVRERGSEKSSGGLKKLLWIVIGIIVVAALGFGVYYLLKTPEFDESETTPDITSQVTPTEIPSPTPTSEPIDRENISIDVLNGTGISGEASYLQGKLRNLGYTDIEVGNASSQDSKVTQVTFSKELPESAKNELTSLFNETYNDVEYSTSSSAKYDVVIATGLRSGQTLPTAEPTAEPTEKVSATPTPESSATPTP